MNKPKLLLRRRDLMAWLVPLGVPRDIVRKSIETKSLTGVHPLGPRSRAFYRRDDVIRIFGLRPEDYQ